MPKTEEEEAAATAAAEKAEASTLGAPKSTLTLSLSQRPPPLPQTKAARS